MKGQKHTAKVQSRVAEFSCIYINFLLIFCVKHVAPLAAQDFNGSFLLYKIFVACLALEFTADLSPFSF